MNKRQQLYKYCAFSFLKMELEDIIPKDISCMYAAQHFASYIQLKQPEPQKGMFAVDKINGVLEEKAKQALSDIEHWAELEENENNSFFSRIKEAIGIGWTELKTYYRIKREVSKEYKKLKKTNQLNKDDEERFKEFFKGFGIIDVPMLILGTAEQYTRENLSEKEKAIQKEGDEWVRQQEDKHSKYLASGGINTPEGHVVWYVAHFGGLHFRGLKWHADAYNLEKTSKDAVKINEAELAKHISIAVDSGLMSAHSHALIANPEKFKADATDWLSTEINRRLSTRLEFNLLDGVAVKKESDGLVYLRIDDHKPY